MRIAIVTAWCFANTLQLQIVTLEIYESFARCSDGVPLLAALLAGANACSRNREPRKATYA